MAPILPFMTEHIWQNMTLEYERQEESIHFSAFPASNNYDSQILEELNVKEIVYLDEFSVLSCEYLALNFQTAGRQLKGDLSMVKSLCDGLSAVEHKSHINSVKNGNVILLKGYDNGIPT